MVRATSILGTKAFSDMHHGDYAAGINVQNLVSALPYSFRRPLFPAHSVAFSLYVFIKANSRSTDCCCVMQVGIAKMNGIGGKPAWAWIFIIEGLITIAAGAVSYWIIVDFPDTASFLTEAERTVVIRRLQGDAQFSAAGEKMQWRHIRKALTDWKTYLASKFT
jgi:hypothetical protein